MKHPGIFVQMEFHPDNKQRYLSDLAKLEGKCGSIELKRESKPRSNQQNRYYWGCVINILSDELGYTPNETHDSMRKEFLVEKGKDGKPDKIRSTTSLNTIEMENYMENIRKWAVAFNGTYIPDPEIAQKYIGD